MGATNSTTKSSSPCPPCNQLDMERKLTHQIERDMRLSQKAQRKSQIVNLLLLGSESSDTSRILRQIEYQHNISTTNDPQKYIIAIRKFAVSSMVKLYTKSKALYTYNPVNYAKFNVDSIPNQYIKLLKSAIKKFDDNSWLNNKTSLYQMIECIQYLWQLDQIKSCWELVYSSNNDIKHYLDKIDIIMDCDSYKPTYTDIMAMPYNNISEISLNFYKTQMNIVTMNGSKFSKKWLHSFDHATGIIFVVSLNDFDQYSRVERKNAFKHSLDLYTKIVNDKIFKRTPVMLILDQFDLFKNKIQTNGASISQLFNDYVDDEDVDKNVEKSLNYIKNVFLNRVENKSKRRGVYIHTTSFYGNNFNQIKQIFKDVQHIKLTKNLDIGGLL